METKLDEYVWVPDANAFISERVRRVSEIVNEYDPGLFIAPIPDQLRGGEPDKDFALIHEHSNGKVYCVKKLKENEIDESLIAWLWSHDNERSSVLARIEAHDAAVRALKLKQQIEEREENKDIGATILGSKLHTFKHNGKKYE